MVALSRSANGASIQPSETASSSTSTATSQYSFSSLAESLNEHLIPAAASAAPALLSRALSHPLPQQQPTDALDAPPQHVRSMRTPPDLVHAFVMQLQDETQTSPLWGLGVFLMIVGTFASALGMLCLKRAHGPAYVNVPWYRNSYLWGGILLFAVTAAGLDVVVFGITPLALIAPFAGLTIVISFLFASFGCCGVRETPTKTTLVAVVLITTGVTICSIWGPKDHGEIDPIDLTRIFDQVRGFYCAAHTYTQYMHTRRPARPPHTCSLAPSFSLTQIASLSIPARAAPGRLRDLHLRRHPLPRLCSHRQPRLAHRADRQERVLLVVGRAEPRDHRRHRRRLDSAAV